MRRPYLRITGIIVYVLPNHVEFSLVSDNPIKIIPLPNRPTLITKHLVNPPRDRGLERTHYRSQRLPFWTGDR